MLGHGIGLGAMAQQVCVVLNNAEREELVAIAADRNRPRKHVERARIVLASAGRTKHRGQPADGMAVASSARSPICRPPSMLILPNTTPAPNLSSGRNQPKLFWLNSTAALYYPFDSVH